MIDAVAAAGGTGDDSRVAEAVARLDLSGLADGFVWALGVTGDPTAARRAPGRTGRRAAAGGADDEVALVGRAGVDVLALPVPWASVLPEGRGLADGDALARLDRRVDDLLALGVTPWPTLHADDAALPGPLRDAGGWTSRETALRLADHAATVHALLADRVSTWTTLAVPAGAGPDALAHRVLAHGLAHSAMRAQAPADHRFGVTVALAGGPDDAPRVQALLAGAEPLDRLGVHYVGGSPRGLPELLARVRREHPAAPPFVVSAAGAEGSDSSTGATRATGPDDEGRVADLLELLDALGVAARAGVGVHGYVAGPVDTSALAPVWPGLDVLRLAVAAVRPA